MKRLMTMIVAVILVAGIGTTVALARGGNGCMGRYYVDADNDGICDHYSTGCGRNFVDANGDGICDHYGTGWGRSCRRA